MDRIVRPRRLPKQPFISFTAKSHTKTSTKHIYTSRTDNKSPKNKWMAGVLAHSVESIESVIEKTEKKNQMSYWCYTKAFHCFRLPRRLPIFDRMDGTSGRVNVMSHLPKLTLIDDKLTEQNVPTTMFDTESEKLPEFIPFEFDVE